eukprot:5538719-Alexandrium_andersonii.AAC.1
MASERQASLAGGGGGIAGASAAARPAWPRLSWARASCRDLACKLGGTRFGRFGLRPVRLRRSIRFDRYPIA